MSALLLPVVISLLLATSATLGPSLLRAAAPVLMRAPRMAVVLLLAGFGAWLLAAAALSLVLAWTLSGPELLPGPYGEVCQRCLDAATPFGQAQTIETSLPIIVLVLLPALGVALLAGLGTLRTLRGRRTAGAVSKEIIGSARRARLADQEVWLVPDEAPVALALPRRRGGIVISEGLRRALTDEEITAVLAHERAHLRQHHHLVLSALRVTVTPLRWMPLAAAIADAVPHYLEIAADRCARDRSGTPALASALLKIGAPISPTGSTLRTGTVHAGAATPMLHAGGPDRIRQLVAPAPPRAALLPSIALAALMLTLVVVTAAVHGPYLQVLLSGCTLPG